MRYSICCLIRGLIRGDLANYISELIVYLGNKFNERYLIEHPRPIHLTLKYPLEKKGDVDEVENLLKLFARRNKAAKLKINKLNQFNNKVIIYDVNFSKEAKEIFSKLQKELRNINWLEWRDYDKNFGKWHITLIYGNTIEKFNTIWRFVNENLKTNFEFEFDNVAILKEVNPNYWKVYKVFDFNKD